MKPEELTRKVALYQSPYGGFIVADYRDGETEGKEYIRVTEPAEIVFKSRAADEVMAAAVKAIDAQIVEAQQGIRKLEARKAELLALPAPEAR